MPTGYTAGIVDGTTKDFKEYATHCMRNFGATMHMRDEPWDKEWEPAKPSDYHIKEIEKAKKRLADAQTLSLEELAQERGEQLEKDKEYHLNKIAEKQIIVDRLRGFLSDAEKFNPPTEEHLGVKRFMIQQIEETIKFDGSDKYHREALERIDAELKDLQPEKIKADFIEYAEKDLKYHETEYKKDVKRCEDSNRWVEQFLQAL